MQERLEQMGPAGPEFVAPHGLDLLDDVGPVQGLVDGLAVGDAPQQRRLMLGPGEDVGVLEVAHGFDLMMLTADDLTRSVPTCLQQRPENDAVEQDPPRDALDPGRRARARLDDRS